MGMMLHQDASTHAWLPSDERRYDMVATIDEATSAIYSLFLVAQEGTSSSLRGVREVIEMCGLFCSLYIDRGSHDSRPRRRGVCVQDRADAVRAGVEAARHRAYPGLYQSSDCLTDARPGASCERHDLPWLLDECVPGIAAVADDVVEALEYSVG
jgi:hypothetical protein